LKENGKSGDAERMFIQVQFCFVIEVQFYFVV